MPAIYKVTFFWTQQTSLLGGWTENYWNSITDLTTVKARADALRLAWFAYKGNPAYCPQYRITDITVFRSAEPIITPSSPNPITAATDADYPTTRGLLQLKCAASKTRQWVGGLRDRDVSSSGNWAPAAESVRLINVVFGLLLNAANGWSCRVLDPAVAPVAILGFNAATGIVTTAPNTIADNARVRVKGVKGIPGANGIWKVTKLTDITFQLIGWIPNTGVMGKGNPTIRAQIYILQAITEARILRSTSHRVGKPSGQLGGRRRKKVS